MLEVPTLSNQQPCLQAGDILGLFLQSFSGLGRKQSQDLAFHSFLYSEQESGTTGEAVTLYINQAHPGIGLSRVSGKRDMRRRPLESRALPGAPVSLPQMHVLPSLSFTPLPGFWALSCCLGSVQRKPWGYSGIPKVLEAPGCSQERHPPFTGGQTLLLGHQHPAGTGHAEPRAQMAERSASWLRLGRKLVAVLSGGLL